jgi:sirohydrochlorin cobaltochelatase
MSSTRSIAPKAPVTNGARSDAALLICAHGVHGGPGVAAVHAETLRRRGVAAEVAACCLKGHPTPGEALAALRAPTVFVLPFLMADGYAARTLLPSALATAPGGADRIRLCPPIGADPRLADAIAEHAMRSCRERGWRPADTALIIAGHGTPRCPTSDRTAHAHAHTIGKRGPFAEVAVAFLEGSARLPDLLPRFSGRKAVVVGLFADRGVHGEEDLRRLLHSCHEMTYAGPLGVGDGIADIMMGQFSDALARADSSTQLRMQPLSRTSSAGALAT